jgi:hypothetical protein
MNAFFSLIYEGAASKAIIAIGSLLFLACAFAYRARGHNFFKFKKNFLASKSVEKPNNPIPEVTYNLELDDNESFAGEEKIQKQKVLSTV